MNHPPPYEFPHYFDSSMVSALLSCEKQFEYQYLRHLAPTAQSIHLTAGAAFAAGLEAVRNVYWLHGLPFREAYAAGFRAAIQSWGPYEPDFPTNKSLPRVLEALYLYFTEWWPITTDSLRPHIRPGGEPSVEWSFAHELPDVKHPDGSPLMYVGRLDMLGEFSGQLFVVDEKTTSQMGAAWTKNWDLRGQFTGYVWAARELRKLPVVGAVVRGVCFRTHDYGNAEVITFRSPWMIEQWLERTVGAIRRLQAAWEANRYLHNHDNACTQYGGCRYLELCTKADPEPWIEGNFDINRWDPLHRSGTAN